MEEKIKYVVMKLNQNIILTDSLGNETKHKLNGKDFAGYIPVFHTYEEALNNSEDGKFQIMSIKIP